MKIKKTTLILIISFISQAINAQVKIDAPTTTDAPTTNTQTTNNNSPQKVDVLTNDDIITLTKTGLSASVIIAKTQSSSTKFDVSTDALINLKKNGVADDVITEMMKKDTQKSTAIANQVDSKDPNAMHKSGVYIYDKSDATTPVKRIQIVRTRYQTSSGGYGGFSGSSTSAIISGQSSRQQIPTQNPVFYFYFPQETKSDDWFASNPNEFALVQVKVIPKKDIRIFKTGGGSSNGYTSSSNEGIPENLKIPFDFTEISEGIYKVTVKSPLEYGEYCFTYADNSTRVFDFGVKKK